MANMNFGGIDESPRTPPMDDETKEAVGKAFSTIALMLFSTGSTVLVSETKVECPDGKWHRYKFTVTEEEL